MSAVAILASGFPNPLGWAVGQVGGLVGGAITDSFGVVLGTLTAWVMGGLTWVVGEVFNFFLRATEPDVSAGWFAGAHGPYATTVGIGAVLLVGFVLIGITQGVLVGDVGGMLRRVGFELPMAVVGMVGLVSLTQVLIRLTDSVSTVLINQFGTDISAFTSAVGFVAGLSGGTGGAFVVFLVGLISVLAGIVLIAELVVRSALIYIVVALAPLVFAAQLWPALRGTGRKLLELLVALIVSKLVVAVALVVAAAAAVGTGAGARVSSLAPPEALGQNGGGSITGAVGVLLAAGAAFGVAAFSPLLVARLLPLTEAAAVASGIRGGPLRAGQQAASASHFARMAGRSRLNSVASGPAAGASGGGVAGAAGAGGVGAAGAIAGRAVAGAAGSGARAASAVATTTVEASPATRRDPGPANRATHHPRRRPPTAKGDDDGE